jgi:hypothetical protein
MRLARRSGSGRSASGGRRGAVKSPRTEPRRLYEGEGGLGAAVNGPSKAPAVQASVVNVRRIPQAAGPFTFFVCCAIGAEVRPKLPISLEPRRSAAQF